MKHQLGINLAQFLISLNKFFSLQTFCLSLQSDRCALLLTIFESVSIHVIQKKVEYLNNSQNQTLPGWSIYQTEDAL